MYALHIHQYKAGRLAVRIIRMNRFTESVIQTRRFELQTLEISGSVLCLQPTERA